MSQKCELLCKTGVIFYVNCEIYSRLVNRQAYQYFFQPMIRANLFSG